MACAWSFIAVNSLKGREGKYIEVAPYLVCESTSHLEVLFQDIVDKGGEGIILRDPKAPYQPGRSPGYLKHKVITYNTR